MATPGTKLATSTSTQIHGGEEVPELRSYELKQDRALAKKLCATDRDIVQVRNTDGGLVIDLNTGMYELLKSVADKFYTHDHPNKCNKIPVKDKKGRLVETKYKLTQRGQGVYTINLYHTTCSCLVNGKQTYLFLERDMPELVKRIEIEVQSQNTSIDNINQSFKKLMNESVSKCTSESTTTMKSSQNPQIQPIADQSITRQALLADQTELIPELTPPKTPPQLKQADKTLSTENTELDTEQSAPSMVDSESQTTATSNDNETLMRKLFMTVNGVQEMLASFVAETRQQTSILKDEIASIKKSVSLANSRTNENIQHLTNQTEVHKTATLTSIENLQKKLQAVQDILKTKQTNGHSAGSMNVSKQITSTGNTRTPPQTQTNNSNSSECSDSKPTLRDRTLIIGSSIVKCIDERGLDSKVDRISCPGAIIPDIGAKTQQQNMARYKNVVVYVGGNDVSSGKNVNASRAELHKLTRHIQRQQCRVYLCNVAPRKDANVSAYNKAVTEVCEATGAELIDVHSSFVFGDGTTAHQLISRDGIHLNATGSRTLVRAINKKVPIIKLKTVSGAHANQRNWNQKQRNTAPSHGDRCCELCGLENHVTRDCRLAK